MHKCNRIKCHFPLIVFILWRIHWCDNWPIALNSNNSCSPCQIRLNASFPWSCSRNEGKFKIVSMHQFNAGYVTLKKWNSSVWTESSFFPIESKSSYDQVYLIWVSLVKLQIILVIYKRSSWKWLWTVYGTITLIFFTVHDYFFSLCYARWANETCRFQFSSKSRRTWVKSANFVGPPCNMFSYATCSPKRIAYFYIDSPGQNSFIHFMRLHFKRLQFWNVINNDNN